MSLACLLRASRRSFWVTPRLLICAATEIFMPDLVGPNGALSSIDSGLMKSYNGKRPRILEANLRRSAMPGCGTWPSCPPTAFPEPSRAPSLSCVPAFPTSAGWLDSLSHRQCGNSQNQALPTSLRAALYSCFENWPKSAFEGGTVTGVSGFSLLEQIKEPQRRKKLFLLSIRYGKH